MNYPIPVSPQEFDDLRQKPVDEELVAAAIAGVIQIARSQGRSLPDLQAEVLDQDGLLDAAQRRWLSDIVSDTWKNLS